MNRWTTAAAAVVVAAGVVFAGQAFATQGVSSAPARSVPSNQPPNHHPAARPAASSPADTAVETKFVPIPPCRIVDTRAKGGPILSLHQRSFNALGTGDFTGQGGSSCGMPTSATAISISLLTVNPSAAGYLRVWAFGAPQPDASFTNYSKGGIVGKSGDVLISHASKDFTVQSVGGSTDVVVDVTGYYIPSMWVEVGSDGTSVGGSRVLSVTHSGTGAYQIDFDRDVSRCGYTGTSYLYGPSLWVQPRIGDEDAVYVGLFDFNGSAVDSYFYLTVTC